MAKECYFEAGKTNCLTHIPEDIKLELDPLNVTVVGSPTVSNGVVSGFSTSNYLTIDNKYKDNNYVEYVFKFTTGSSFSAQQCVVHAEYFINIEITTSGAVQYYSWGGKASTTLFTATANSTYWVKIIINGISKTYSYSTDGVTFTGSKTFTDSGLQPSNTSYQFRLGLSSYNSTNPFLGSIDVSNCYAKVIGTLVWQGGTGTFSVLKNSKIYIPNGYEADGTTLKFDEVIVANDTPSSVVFNDNSKMWAVYYGKRLITALDTFSGSTTPTDLTDYHYDMFYNTTENKCYYCIQVGGVWMWEQVSLPLGLVARTKASGYTAITQVFNGFGYIGGVSFYLPGIKGFVPHGYNTDGTYKSDIINVTKVLLCTDTSTRNNADIRLSSTATGYGDLDYNSALNQNEVNGSFRGFASVGKISISDGEITSLTINDVVEKSQPLKVNSIYIGSKPTNCLTHIPNDIDLGLEKSISTTNWTQPTLSANGSVGGNAFAVTGSAESNSSGNRYFYHAFDNNTSTYWRCNSGTGYIEFYNPVPLRVTNLKWTYYYCYPTGGNVQGSNDRTNWTTIKTWTNSSAADFNISLSSNNNAYKYYRINITGVNKDVIHCKQLTITAQEQNTSLVLKAGSKVYVPNGFEEDGTTPKFDEVVVSRDSSVYQPYSDTRMLFIRHNSDTDTYIDGYPVGQCHSGSTAPTESQWMFWYDTSSNIIKRSNDNGVSWDNYYSFPVCIYTNDKGGVTSIDQVLNGFGYIGNTMFMLPNIKGITANGYKDNGTYNGTEFTIDKPTIWTDPWFSAGNLYYAYNPERREITNYFVDELVYDKNTNLISYRWGPENVCIVARYVAQDGGKITSLTPKKVQPEMIGRKINFIYKGSTRIFCDVPSKTFNASSSIQTYTVPNGVTKLHVDCVASQGGNSGGKGGRVQCDLNVTPGDTLYIMVGAVPSNIYTASYNASDIRIGGKEYSNRVVVAGGGGSKSSRNIAGGAGGGLTGGDGTGHSNAYKGAGGTQTAGGAGGRYTAISQGHSHQGGDGTFGLGGSGTTCSYCGQTGAGGAGWYGGGAGAGQHNKNGDFAAGGGGGSSYTDSSLCSNVTHTQGYRSGAGYITISVV